jgi:hypothetical protein
MCTSIFDCPILGPVQHCYNICQWKGGSLHYQTHWVIICPSKKELFLKWTVFQIMASYTCHLWVFRNLELCCEHNKCHCQIIQIILFPTSLVFGLWVSKIVLHLNQTVDSSIAVFLPGTEFFWNRFYICSINHSTFVSFWWPNCCIWWYHFPTCVVQNICKKRSLDITSPKNCICFPLTRPVVFYVG